MDNKVKLLPIVSIDALEDTLLGYENTLRKRFHPYGYESRDTKIPNPLGQCTDKDLNGLKYIINQEAIVFHLRKPTDLESLKEEFADNNKNMFNNVQIRLLYRGVSIHLNEMVERIRQNTGQMYQRRDNSTLLMELVRIKRGFYSERMLSTLLTADLYHYKMGGRYDELPDFSALSEEQKLLINPLNSIVFPEDISLVMSKDTIKILGFTIGKHKWLDGEGFKAEPRSIDLKNEYRKKFYVFPAFTHFKPIAKLADGPTEAELTEGIRKQVFGNDWDKLDRDSGLERLALEITMQRPVNPEIFRGVR